MCPCLEIFNDIHFTCDHVGPSVYIGPVFPVVYYWNCCFPFQQRLCLQSFFSAMQKSTWYQWCFLSTLKWVWTRLDV